MVSNGSFIFLHQINALNVHNLNITSENDPKARKKKKKTTGDSDTNTRVNLP